MTTEEFYTATGLVSIILFSSILRFIFSPSFNHSADSITRRDIKHQAKEEVKTDTTYKKYALPKKEDKGGQWWLKKYSSGIRFNNIANAHSVYHKSPKIMSV